MSAPEIIGPYEIGELLGRGGMGEVYKAVDTRMYRRPVALKLMSEAMGADPRALSRFDLEIETAANLRHPNIVQIYDRGEYEGRRYFAMEFLEGRDLSAVIKERDARSLDARLDIIVQLCEALDYAHTHGVVHRDIKPANILVITRGGTDHVKLVDFGIAHVTRGDHTRTVVQPGTTLYMSPEQLKDEPVTPRSDLFSLGIVAYELCAGVHPFKGRTDYLTSSNIMFEKQPPLHNSEPLAPEGLESLLDRLLEKHGDSRPASAADVAAELKKLIRQIRSIPSESETGSFGNLDEMTAGMVERIVHWAKGKESAGALVEAREAYKRAILLAPDVSWLHVRVARIDERLQGGPPQDVPPSEDDAGLHTSSRNRHREAFIQERMVEADAALDDGELDRASSIVAVVLRQYPDDARALALMDRIVLITDRGLAVKPYRQALRAARDALALGDVPSARRSREVAVAIWPDDDEVITLGREIDRLAQVELAKALSACDDVLAGAAAGTLEDDSAPSAVAGARDALRRAEEIGAPATLIGPKAEALNRIEREALARKEEREREANEAEEARRAEVKQLLDDARRRLAAAERAATADPASARAVLADVRSALSATGRAAALGAPQAETAEMTSRLEAAARSLEDRIAHDDAREREIAVRLDTIRSGLADVERHAAGNGDEILQAGEVLRTLESELASVAADRPSAAGLASLRSTAAGLRERVEAHRRVEVERARQAELAREAKEARERAEKAEQERQARVAREAKEAQARAEREERERRERLERERAARLQARLAEAREAFKKADDLAASVETEADVMLEPLAAARRAVEELLRIDAGDPDAKALLPKIEKLAEAANMHAKEAARLRREAEQRRRDASAKREAERRAALNKRLTLGGVAAVVVALAVGGWFAFGRRQSRHEDTSTAGRKTRPTSNQEQAEHQLADVRTKIRDIRAGVHGIASEEQRANLLARCDTLPKEIDAARQLDASNADIPRISSDVATLRTEIRGLVIPRPGQTPETSPARAATLDRIQRDLKLAGDAPREPIEKIDEALSLVDDGVGLANDLIGANPKDTEARALLTELQRTRSTLLRWRQPLVKEGDTAAQRQALQRQRNIDAAGALVAKIESQLKSGKPLADPDAAVADCRQAQTLVDQVLRDDPGQRQALSLQGRIAKSITEVNGRRSQQPKIPDEVARKPQPEDTLPGEIDAIIREAQAQALTSAGGVTARILKDKEGLRKLAAAGGAEWAKSKTAALQADLDTALVWNLFYRYRDALVARNPEAILDAYPGYPSLKAITDLRDYQFSFEILDLNVAAKTARVRQTGRGHQKPDFWDRPVTVELNYALGRRPDGAWHIVSASVAR